eukprot:CAMPEP_0168858320 /NCGR_PEP_ID=MMETSP0727-20121128/16226_1 /TAXON_ID=265536 /ORGANISM="Amphiprora sp., Strain CCMP467" /LENGTH=421 /DNA_ID=CAMNT_0008913059 /DNA_START=38 /DNA_END=1304 /DNA_ORIENTATION=-
MSDRVPWQDSNLAAIGSDLDHKVKQAAAEGEEAWAGTGKEAVINITMSDRVPWQDSNLAAIGSDLDHKVKQAAAEGEEAWAGTGKEAGVKVWRIEQFKIVDWPTEKYGSFHTGDSYIVLNSYKQEGSEKLIHDIHIWIGKESSQDEYGTSAYKMVELDEYLGGSPVQHREVEGSESPMFQSYFGSIKVLDGGVDTGFRHVEASKDKPHLYKIKGTERGMSLTQISLSKSSLNQGDSFILFANPATVWVWHGASSNPDEKAKANREGEEMCTEGTVVAIEASEPEADNAEFWAYLGDGEIQAAEDGDKEVKNFVPILFLIKDYGKGTEIKPEKIAEAQPIKMRWGPPTSKLQKSFLDDSDVFLLDAGWEVYLWMGKSCDKSEKLAGMAIAESYMKSNPRTVDLPLSILKSGWETQKFNEFFE